MAEETQSAPQVQTEAAPLTDHGKMIANTLEMAAKDAKFAALPEVKAVVDYVAAQKGATQPATQAAPEATVQTQVKDFRAEEKTAEPETKAEAERKSVLFSKKVDKPAAEFKAVEDYSKYIKEKFGVEDPAAFMSSAEKWRNDSQSLSEVSDKATGLEQIFEKMPDVMYDAIQAWGRGEDWVDKIKSGLPTLDYNKPFEKQTEKIVNQYFPGKFTQEQLEDTSDAIVKNAIDVAKAKFDLEKEKVQAQRGQVLERAEKQAKSIKDSAEASVSKLTEAFPEIDSRRKSEIKSMLVSGDLDSLFKKPDGSWKPDAAVRVAMALFGEDEIASRSAKVEQKTAAKTQSQVLMNVIDKGATSPHKTPESQTQGAVMPEDVTKLLDGVNRKSFY